MLRLRHNSSDYLQRPLCLWGRKPLGGDQVYLGKRRAKPQAEGDVYLESDTESEGGSASLTESSRVDECSRWASDGEMAPMGLRVASCGCEVVQLVFPW